VAITDKLNSAWGTNQAMDAVFEFRAAAQNAYNVLIETVAKIDALTSSAKFTSVDAEIKSSGAAIRTILNQSKAALDAYAAFLNWAQPKV
jgi:hypothetical protein